MMGLFTTLSMFLYAEDQGSFGQKIKSCYDFMKRGNAALFGERFTRLRRSKGLVASIAPSVHPW
jgi:hypothetical protein